MSKIHRIPVLGAAFSFNGLVPRFTQDRHGSATRSVALNGRAAMESQLLVKVFDKNGRERKVSEYFGNKENFFKRSFYRLIYRNKTQLDLGSGLITNVSQLALANDWNLAAPSGAAINLLKLANYHCSGTGTTAAAATDIQLQTASTNGGQNPVAGTQSLVSAANLQKLQTVATIAYTGSEAVTEWGLITQNSLSATTGTPATASSATSLTATGTPYTASNSTTQGQQQHIVQDTTASPKVWGLITSNTTSVLTVPAWYKSTDGTAGSTPGSTDAFNLLPIILDHKVFSAINVVNGDSIQYTYLLTCATGG